MGTSSSRHQSSQQQPSSEPQQQRPGASPQGQANPNTAPPNSPPRHNPYAPPPGPPHFFPQPYPHPRAAAPYYSPVPYNPYSPYPYPPQTNGQFYTGGGAIRPPPQSYLPPPPMPVAVQEPQRTAPIRNDVNLKKQSLRLERDEVNPGFWLVAFSLDASLAGSASILWMAKEGESCSLTSVRATVPSPIRFPFKKELGQKYVQPAGLGIKLSDFTSEELSKEGPGGVYPLVIRLETEPKNPPPDAPPPDTTPGAKLPRWVQSQTTYATIIKQEDGGYKIKVLRQKIWVDGVSYELQEIYGIESNSGATSETDHGKECVVCLSEPRDTTVLPCRHMCMCGECAKVLRYQTNRCPVCRTVIDSLLEIKVENKSPAPSPAPSPLPQK
eukprot:TRINITY_DN18421_c0_g1_i1.p1 TRINITY_DN18421_c0_g1~~TRINITY_DN18421_c0_g1_i1.p1  ORF type:complete len:384 (-),score=32.16 TRINITY_DN18421_c0_g1_i1:336-1487(-)